MTDVKPITKTERDERVKWAKDVDYTKARVEARSHSRTILKYEARLQRLEEALRNAAARFEHIHRRLDNGRARTGTERMLLSNYASDSAKESHAALNGETE